MIKTDEQQKLHAQMLVDCKNILTLYNVHPILTGSALLGYMREGQLIKWCPGVVLSCFRDEIIKHENAIICDLQTAGFKIIKHYNGLNYKIRAKKKSLNVEILGYSFDGENYYRQLKNKKKIIPKVFFDKTSIIKFYDVIFLAPKNIKKFLEFCYVDWKTPMTGSPSSYKNKSHMVVK